MSAGEANQVLVQIWTKDGLMYEKDLDYSHAWEFLPSKEACEVVRFSETYKLKTTGEIVKHAVHLCLLKSGVEASGLLGQMNDPAAPAAIVNQGEQVETS